MIDVTEADTEIIRWGRSWMAVRSDDATVVVHALRLRDIRECFAPQGLDESIAQFPPPEQRRSWRGFWKTRKAVAPPKKCFVAAPVDGWTLVFADDLAFEDATMAELSRTFGEAQAFYCDAKHSNYYWARMRSGNVVRRVEVVVGDGQLNVVGEGQPPEPIVGEERLPQVLLRINERDVLRVARAWSVDPNALLLADARGYVGTRPE